MRFDLPYLVFGMLACISIHVQAAPFNAEGVADDGLVVRDSLTSPNTHLRVRASSSEQSRRLGGSSKISIDQEGVPTITFKIQADGKVVSRNIRVMDGKVVS
ncbi:hypothetical protein LENED_008284 [Lentinula edodes]|uniref:Uncharacterized protein n=1 Tax=Lentinula edodes TaxID=5353 RepID=A0A1Q3EGT4_LENED|nr:hypothetical protein LENED_008284 [Lentinula edodes]